MKVSDVPNLLTNHMRLSLTIQCQMFRSKNLEMEQFRQIVRTFTEFHSSGGCLPFPKRFSGKFPFDFKPKFPNLSDKC